MKVKLLGLQELDFATDRGDKIKGTNIWISYPEKDVTGETAVKCFLSPELLGSTKLSVGLNFNIEFNAKGKIAAISALNATV